MYRCFEELLEPEAGCCGMAGVFGLRKKTAYIGDKLYQRNLAAPISDCTSDTRVVSNGFSCRKQIADNSEIKVWHPIEIMDACIR